MLPSNTRPTSARNNMLVHQKQRVPRNHLLHSFHGNHQTSRNHDGDADTEFTFWGSRKTWYHGNLGTSDGNETEFQIPAEADYKLRDDGAHETSPLLPHKNLYRKNSLSLMTTRSQVIAEGRKELMQMVHDMPESSYELSLKDMVDEKHHHVSEQAQEGVSVEEIGSICMEAETKIKNQEQQKKKKKKKTMNLRQISRTGSMDTDTFLIKMFFPAFLGPKQKANTGNGSKVSLKPASERSETQIDKQWWIKKIFTSSHGKNRGKLDSSSSASSSASSSSGNRTIRHDNGTDDFIGCWLFFHSKKGKTTTDRDCFSE